MEVMGGDLTVTGGRIASNLAFNLGGTGVPPTVAVVPSGSDYSVELRVRFPEVGDETMSPSQLSGSIWTLSSGSLYSSVWYEIPSASSLTGNIYATSSFGRVQLTSASLFDGRFYSIACVSDASHGGVTLSAMRYEAGEAVYMTSSFIGASPPGNDFNRIEVGSSHIVSSFGEFWAQELRVWSDALNDQELRAHAQHFESYGRDDSYDNSKLRIHLRLGDGSQANSSGSLGLLSSIPSSITGTASGLMAGSVPFTKFLDGYSYIPSIDYGWNQSKVRVFDGSRIDPFEAYHDERYVSLEFNMYDALNEDISHLMSSYDELNRVVGLPVNRYREEYEGLIQMRETYFKRLQGELRFRVFADMLDFFDTSFSSIVERLLPARASFKGDEMIIESHMLERPKYQYQLRPIIEGRIEISGSISVVDRGGDW